MKCVLIVVFDGLQPAQVTPGLMPNLAGLANEGVTFSNHHAVFPTVTRTNAATMVTGRYPGGHGLTGNVLVVPEFDPYLAFSALEPALSEVAAKTPVLLSPTLADILSRHGQEFIAVGTGTSGNAYLQNPNAESYGGATIHPDFCLPRRLHDEILDRFGPWPSSGETNGDLLTRAVEIITGYVLPDRRPLVSLLWFSEPDHAQHAHGVGSAVALQAIHEADQQFGRLLSCLEERELSGDTNVMVVSDHGYSTISEVIAIEASVRTAGFPPGEEPGGVTVAANGGSVLFYTHGADTATADRLAAWLMSQPWCGALAAFGGTEAPAGTLPMSLIGLDGTRAPQLAMSFRWDSTSNNAGYQGRAYSSGLAPGQGQHGSMSRHETRNVLFARGPDFKQGVSLTSPTGNTDLAPTILHLLGLPGGEGMDGRVLHEALRGAPESVDWHTAVHYAERRVEGGFYRQSITVSQVGSTTYVDEGQGGVE